MYVGMRLIKAGGIGVIPDAERSLWNWSNWIEMIAMSFTRNQAGKYYYRSDLQDIENYY